MASKTPEQQLHDATVRHQVHLMRLAAGLRNEMMAEIIKGLNEAAYQIERQEVGTATTRRQVEARVDAILTRLEKSIDRSNTQSEARLRDTADEEAAFMSRLWRRWFGV